MSLGNPNGAHIGNAAYAALALINSTLKGNFNAVSTKEIGDKQESRSPRPAEAGNARLVTATPLIGPSANGIGR